MPVSVLLKAFNRILVELSTRYYSWRATIYGVGRS